MRVIKYIVIHCTAGPQNQPTAEILAFWRNVNGWKSPGYHFEINADGTYEELLPIDKIANGVAGHNANSIHISYKGGIDKNGKPLDNRTDDQKKTQLLLINKYKAMFPNAVVLGHRDFSTDKNGNGIIESWEWIKSCPAFDVRDWLAKEGLEKSVKPVGIIYKLNYPLIKDNKVKELQVALNNAGYKIAVDRFFGKETNDALIAFQRRNNLLVNGILDKPTAHLLKISI
jgi:N-acetylmuramoyl-L-alanine amidase